MLRYLTAGESHGPYLAGILEGLPSGLAISPAYINKELKKRQKGIGRSERMSLEKDRVKILAGLEDGKTTGAPFACLIKNRARKIDPKPFHFPRPGHADLTGFLKYNTSLATVAERASARNTAMLVALGAVGKKLLAEFKINIFSHVLQIGTIKAKKIIKTGKDFIPAVEKSNFNCLDPEAEKKILVLIEEAKKTGDTLGGVFEVLVTNVPPGIGTFVHGDRRLDGCLAHSVMSIPSVKGVEIGLGFTGAEKLGSSVHDALYFCKKISSFYRLTNNAGGLEGGMSNGETIVIRAAVKPIPTLKEPLPSFNLQTLEPALAHTTRADICAVPSVSIVGEAVVALELAGFFLEKFAGDTLNQIKSNFSAYQQEIKNSFQK